MSSSIPRDLTPSMEDCLETILGLIRRKGTARVRDIAARLGVRSSTTSNALRSMARRNLVDYRPYHSIKLTDRGREIAEEIDRRHVALEKFLGEVLGLEEGAAGENACRMEHCVSDVVLRRLGYLAEFLERHPAVGRESWLSFRRRSQRADPGAGGPAESADRSKTMTLAEVKPERKAKVLDIKGEPASVRRLADMGLTRGVVVSVVRVAPLGDPVEIKVRGYNLSLRKNEAKAIEVEEVS